MAICKRICTVLVKGVDTTSHLNEYEIVSTFDWYCIYNYVNLYMDIEVHGFLLVYGWVLVHGFVYVLGCRSI